MHINNQAKWVILEQHLGEGLRTKKSQQPVSDLRFEHRAFWANTTFPDAAGYRIQYILTA
jgi:hypothetical protein